MIMNNLSNYNISQEFIEICIALTSETNFTRLIDKIVSELRRVTHADGGSLYLQEGMVLHFLIAQNDSLGHARQEDFRLFGPFSVPVNKKSIAGFVAKTGKILNVPDVQQLPATLPYRYDSSFDARNNYRTHSILAIPLKDHDGTMMGVLELINAQNEHGQVIPFGPQHENVARALSSLAAVAINNARLIKTICQRYDDEQERHRRNLEAIFHSVRDAIITVDQNMTILEVSEAAGKLCGLVPANVMGKPFMEVVRYCNKSCVDLLKDGLTKHNFPKEYRLECRYKLRPNQIVMVTCAPLRNKEHSFLGAVLVIRDITQITEMERKLQHPHLLHNIVGQSSKMLQVYRLLDQLIKTDTNVLIAGETGTGKELIARALHYGSPRASKPLVSVNCSALAENLLESELFGHVKGAFTGAARDRMGRFQAAHGGTIFLDEIGDISPLIQSKLLRVLEYKQIERVGESRPIPVDVRLVAATHRNLKQLVQQGTFREDLYYRLKVMEISLPPLRGRPGDLPLLVDHFCSLFNKRFQKPVDGASREVLQAFQNYPWPGNIRELENALEHAFVLCNGPVITLEHLPPEIQAAWTGEAARGQGAPLTATDLRRALDQTQGNKTKAARLLGISRQTLYELIAKHNLVTPPKTYPRKRKLRLT
jgi:two-component system response regulator HydG